MRTREPVEVRYVKQPTLKQRTSNGRRRYWMVWPSEYDGLRKGHRGRQLQTATPKVWCQQQVPENRVRDRDRMWGVVAVKSRGWVVDVPHMHFSWLHTNTLALSLKKVIWCTGLGRCARSAGECVWEMVRRRRRDNQYLVGTSDYEGCP